MNITLKHIFSYDVGQNPLFEPKLNIRSRYEKCIVNPELYSTIILPKSKRIYSELDPYGEEDWDN